MHLYELYALQIFIIGHIQHSISYNMSQKKLTCELRLQHIFKNNYHSYQNNKIEPNPDHILDFMSIISFSKELKWCFLFR